MILVYARVLNNLIYAISDNEELLNYLQRAGLFACKIAEIANQGAVNLRMQLHTVQTLKE